MILNTESFVKNPENHFDTLKLVGNGTYGQVFKVRSKSLPKFFAAKIVQSNEKTQQTIATELFVLSKVSDHPNIVDFYGIYLSSNQKNEVQNLWLILEYCGGGSVSQLIKYYRSKRKFLKQSWCIYIIHEVLQGLSYLHDKNIIHRDIKSSNIMFTNQMKIKIIDFGVCTVLSKEKTSASSVIGTPHWMAPEVFLADISLGLTYDERCDVWSIGITAIELADSFPPFHKIEPSNVFETLKKYGPQNVSGPKKRSNEYKSFISKCLVMNHNKRPYVHTILYHKMFINSRKNYNKIVNSIGIKIYGKKKVQNGFNEDEATPIFPKASAVK